MQKRPSMKLEQSVVDRALALRRDGKTIRAIAAQLDLSTSTVHGVVAGLSAGGERAATAEDLERAGEFDQLVREALLVVRGLVHDIGQRLKGPTASAVSSRDLNAATRMIVEVQKLAMLLRGNATARTETVQSGTVEVQHTEAEAAVLAALRARQGLQ